MANKLDKNHGEEIWVTRFDEEHAQKFREHVMKVSHSNPSKPIVVYIDSYGGYVDSLAMMIDTLDEVPNPIITACVGKAMSCGAILLSHGDLRYCGPNSRIMVHEISSATWGDVHDIHADTIEAKRLNRHFMGLLAKNCGIKGGYDGLRKIIKERDGRDVYLDGHAAIQFGIVDKVGTPRVQSVKLFDVTPTPKKSIQLAEGHKRAVYKKTVKRSRKKTSK